MSRQLHILTTTPDEFTRTLLAALESAAAVEVTVADLTVENPDYPGLVHQIFESDSIATW